MLIKNYFSIIYCSDCNSLFFFLFLLLQVLKLVRFFGLGTYETNYSGPLGLAQVDENTVFSPRCKGEIGGYAWYTISELPDKQSAPHCIGPNGKRIVFFKVR